MDYTPAFLKRQAPIGRDYDPMTDPRFLQIGAEISLVEGRAAVCSRGYIGGEMQYTFFIPATRQTVSIAHNDLIYKPGVLKDVPRCALREPWPDYRD